MDDPVYDRAKTLQKGADAPNVNGKSILGLCLPVHPVAICVFAANRCRRAGGLRT